MWWQSLIFGSGQWDLRLVQDSSKFKKRENFGATVNVDGSRFVASQRLHVHGRHFGRSPGYHNPLWPIHLHINALWPGVGATCIHKRDETDNHLSSLVCNKSYKKRYWLSEEFIAEVCPHLLAFRDVASEALQAELHATPACCVGNSQSANI